MRAAIERAANEEGVDPSFALAVAERESSFNPTARSSKSIRGLFQMRGDHRAKYGIGDSNDPYVQAKGWSRFIKDERASASRAAGRDITDPELYGAHHWGAGRAGRMLNMDPSTPVSSVFTPNEIAQNPHFSKAGTVGNLLSSVTGDIDRRRTKFGGATELPDFSAFGQPVEAGPAQLPDFSHMGAPVEFASVQPPPSAPDFSNSGRPII
jgi:hypothetical protein